MNSSKRLIIFEGPDGAGKTTAARRVAKELGALYVHLGPFKNLPDSIGRLYVEAMMPAVLGHCDVVMDRSWLSEQPYGQAYRGNLDRLGTVQRRLIERLALRCQTLLVLALPPYEVARDAFARRKHEEMLKDETQLRQVYDFYATKLTTALPVERWDYTTTSWVGLLSAVGDQGTMSHTVGCPSAGNLTAPILLVGDGFPEHSFGDPLYQWPFGALSGAGQSHYLTRKLQSEAIGENDLCWVNADADDGCLHYLSDFATARKVFSLGNSARDKLDLLGIPHAHYHHPQHHRRLGYDKPYPLIDGLKEALKNV